MISLVPGYEHLLQKAVKEFKCLSLADLHMKTGTSIVAFACDEGIVMASDLQGTMGYIKIEVEYKIMDFIWADKNKYMIGLAGVSQIISFIITNSNEFYNWYCTQFLRKPSLDNMVQYLRILNNRTGWNNYGHIIIGGICQRFNNYQVSCLRYGDYIKIGPKCKYLSIGSGFIFLNAVVDTLLDSLNTLEECKAAAKKSLKVSTHTDLYSGLGIQVYTLSKQYGITIEDIKFD